MLDENTSSAYPSFVHSSHNTPSPVTFLTDLIYIYIYIYICIITFLYTQRVCVCVCVCLFYLWLKDIDNYLLNIIV